MANDMVVRTYVEIEYNYPDSGDCDEVQLIQLENGRWTGTLSETGLANIGQVPLANNAIRFRFYEVVVLRSLDTTPPVILKGEPSHQTPWYWINADQIEGTQTDRYVQLTDRFGRRYLTSVLDQVYRVARPAARAAS